MNKKKSALDDQEEELKKDEKGIEEQYKVANRALNDATRSLKEAIDKSDMTGIRVSTDLLDSAKKRFDDITVHRGEQAKIRAKISKKRKNMHDYLMNHAKKSK